MIYKVNYVHPGSEYGVFIEASSPEEALRLSKDYIPAREPIVTVTEQSEEDVKKVVAKIANTGKDVYKDVIGHD